MISPTSIPGALKRRWKSEAGYRDLLTVAVPLIFSTGSWALQTFIDRMFLNWYSREAVAGSMPAGLLNFTIVSLFLGTAGYVSTFVAQYYGSEQKRMIGPVVWQGVYISLVSGVFIMALAPLSRAIFDAVGHDPAVRGYESSYFAVLCLGAVPLIASSALSGFFSGLGRTWIVLIANFAATLENIVMDYILIFGKFGFPRMGITGAGIATALSPCVCVAIYAAIMFRDKCNEEYNTRGGWRPDRPLLGKLIRFGLPNGAQFFLDMAGITGFVLIIGRLGTAGLAATTIALNVNTFAFMPMIGLGITISVLVGQYLGMNRPDLAEYSVFSGLHIAVFYMGAIAILYLVVPDMFLALYALGADGEVFRPTAETVRLLLRFVVIYSVFDAMNIVFSSAIKGAGDTRFVMFAIVILSGLWLIVPSYVVLIVLDMGIYAGWCVLTGYVILMGLVFMVRFRGGKWKGMRVIEEPHAVFPPLMPEAHAGGIEVRTEQ